MLFFKRNARNVAFMLLWLAAAVWPQSAGAITLAEEQKLSREFMRIVEARFEIIKDPLIVDYVDRIGRTVLAVVPSQPFKYRFFVIKADDYNAFAGPGGVIFINSGLLTAMQSEDELAGIVGHEITHVVCRHISDRIERSKKTSLVTLAGLLASMALGAGGAATAASAAAVGSVAAAQSLELAYSREDEMQADQLGVDFLVMAGYNPIGLQRALTRIRDKQWFGPQQVPTYLLTHPASEDRIAYISSWLENHQETVAKLKPRDPHPFARTQIRTLALYGDAEVARRVLQNRLAANPKDPLTHYGIALERLRAGRQREAIDFLRKALSQRAFDADFLTELGRAYYLDGQYENALQSFDGALGIGSDNPDGPYFKGRTLLSMGRTEAATTILQQLYDQRPQFRDLGYFLSQAYGKQQALDQAHFYLGRYHLDRKAYQTALVQLDKALQLTRDPERKKEIQILIKKARKQKQKQDREAMQKSE